MAIRITGMYSGLDTEAIISELVSAQSVKKNKYVKDQTKLSWKMDAWKALNTKIYNFYTNTLDNMRWQASFMKKATKVSSSAISVIPGSNAVNGTQSVRVEQLAKSGRLTGAELEGATSSTKLGDLGIGDDASFEVTIDGKKTTIRLDSNMKISDVVKKLQDLGLDASFDNENHRFFVGSKESGKAADFTITANNELGLEALKSLGLLSKSDLANDEYKQWAEYVEGSADYEKLIKDEAAKRAADLKKANEDLAAKNKSLLDEIDKLKEDNADIYDEDITADDVDRLQGALDAAKEALETAKKNLADGSGDQAAVDAAQAALDNTQADFNKVNKQYAINKQIEDKNAQIETNKDQIEANKEYFTESAPDDDGNTTAIAKSELEDKVRAEFNDKVAIAKKVVSGDYASGEDDEYATRVVGQNAVIYVDDAKFTSSSNDFNINGMTITAYETTGDHEVTITTSNDVDGIYDMVKNFFTEYNNLINEMSALYNADSSKGYDPLLSEEKADMAESEIEEWEKKIKDSLLRRDSTLGELTDAIKIVMMQGATVNGKTMYLSDFGINTLGYFNAADNEKSAYHIDGDPDDVNVSGNNDKLKMMIANDPDAVMNFFSGLSRNLYDKLTEKMSAVKDTSSAFTVYNDKLLQKEYNDYKDKIAKEEEKLNALMDKWYAKFSAMETALAKLQSKSGGLAGLLGGQ